MDVDLENALANYLECAILQEEYLGDFHLDLHATRCALASCFMDLQKPDLALPYHRQTMATYECVFVFRPSLALCT